MKVTLRRSLFYVNFALIASHLFKLTPTSPPFVALLSGGCGAEAGAGLLFTWEGVLINIIV